MAEKLTAVKILHSVMGHGGTAHDAGEIISLPHHQAVELVSSNRAEFHIPPKAAPLRAKDEEVAEPEDDLPIATEEAPVETAKAKKAREKREKKAAAE